MTFNSGFLGRDLNPVLNEAFSALLVVGSVAISYIHRARPGTDIFNVAKAWITAYFSMTMCSNIICSGEPHSCIPSRPSLRSWAFNLRDRGYRDADIPRLEISKQRKCEAV